MMSVAIPLHAPSPINQHKSLRSKCKVSQPISSQEIGGISGHWKRPELGTARKEGSRIVVARNIRNRHISVVWRTAIQPPWHGCFRAMNTDMPASALGRLGRQVSGLVAVNHFTATKPDTCHSLQTTSCPNRSIACAGYGAGVSR